jgi:hypothetical protein
VLFRSGQTHDQLDGFRRQPGPASPTVGIGPAAADEGAVPAKDCLGGDEERRPPLPRDQLRQRGDERPIGSVEARTGDLSAEDGELVAQHQDLRLLGDDVHPVDPGQLEDASDESVEEAERHRTGASPSASSLVKPKIE